MPTETLIHAYYAAFTGNDREAMLDLLADDVVHDVNQGPREVGKDAFRRFLAHMDHSYRETLTDIVIMVDPSDTRAAAEFMVEGEYRATDAGLPEARGQRYSLPAGAFFAVEDGLITRITTYYNLQEWVRQVGEARQEQAG